MRHKFTHQRMVRLGLLAAVTTVGVGYAAMGAPGVSTATFVGSGAVTTSDVYMSGDQQTATGVPGDPDGIGRAKLVLDSRANTVCFDTSWDNIGAPIGAHIHQGAAGEFENILFTFNLFTGLGNSLPQVGYSSPRSGCMRGLLPGQVAQIQRNPSDYLVVLHNLRYPLGAIRGQL